MPTFHSPLDAKLTTIGERPDLRGKTFFYPCLLGSKERKEPDIDLVLKLLY
jgi:hypothetical protein